MSDKKIMYDSPEAAKLTKLRGWVSSDGLFYKDNEHLARWGGCTHLTCACGEIHAKMYTKCSKCRAKADRERFLKLPFKEWNGEPVVIFCSDEYFFSEEDLDNYITDNGITEKSKIELVICEGNYLHEIDGNDIFCDLLPEDQYLDDVASEASEAFAVLNNVISKQTAPISWSPGKYRTALKD